MDIIKSILQDEYITAVGYATSNSFRMVYPHLLPSFDVKGAIMFLIPYKYSPAYTDINISKYAAAKDYHLYVKELGIRVLPKIKKAYPEHEFSMFCDASPIDERICAARAGLGVMGKNNMLINDTYGSYCFIGSILTTYVPVRALDAEVYGCSGCGKCIDACQSKALVNNDMSLCLSAVSQNKRKTPEDIEIIKNHSVIWGCDVCQDVCPMNKDVKDTDIPFFRQDIIAHLTYDIVNNMSTEQFESRAFAWRGKSVILENLHINNH